MRQNHTTLGLINNTIVEIKYQMPLNGQSMPHIPSQQHQLQSGLPHQNGYGSFPGPSPQQPIGYSQQFPSQQQPQPIQTQSVHQAGPQPFSPPNRVLPNAPTTYIQHHRIPDQIASK